MANVRKLVVEVIEARGLLPKDGYGASSPYVILDFYCQTRKTKTVSRDLNPVWNETVEFNVGKHSEVFGDTLVVDVYHDKSVGPTTRNNFLGRVRLSSGQFVRRGEEALIFYPLEKKHLFSWVQGDIGLKIYYDLFPSGGSSATAPELPPRVENPPEEVNTSIPPVNNDAAVATADPPSVKSPPEEVMSPPLVNGSGGVDAPPPEKEEDLAGDLGGKDQMGPEIELDNVTMASVTSSDRPEVKVHNINGPKPINRTPSVSSFVSDLSERSAMERSTFDLVEKMHYLFVRVVKARSLPPSSSGPVTRIAVLNHHVISKPARITMSLFEWDQTFAFRRDAPDDTSPSSVLEVSVWDPPGCPMSTGQGSFLGGICFDAGEIPLRDPPDSPLAPQWYRLEGGGAHKGDLMLATWVGTQADESFPEAWKTDTAGNPNSESKVYQSPKLLYLRSSVIEAQDISPVTESNEFQY